ncbi:MAG: hypothetical protein M1816_002191 [Peltula sp. TS41687]|nr:MAG: hypothetical protein M1816_002191 [Peltula sp. TS41687]
MSRPNFDSIRTVTVKNLGYNVGPEITHPGSNWPQLFRDPPFHLQTVYLFYGPYPAPFPQDPYNFVLHYLAAYAIVDRATRARDERRTCRLDTIIIDDRNSLVRAEALIRALDMSAAWKRRENGLRGLYILDPPYAPFGPVPHYPEDDRVFAWTYVRPEDRTDPNLVRSFLGWIHHANWGWAWNALTNTPQPNPPTTAYGIVNLGAPNGGMPWFPPGVTREVVLSQGQVPFPGQQQSLQLAAGRGIPLVERSVESATVQYRNVRDGQNHGAHQVGGFDQQQQGHTIDFEEVEEDIQQARVLVEASSVSEVEQQVAVAQNRATGHVGAVEQQWSIVPAGNTEGRRVLRPRPRERQRQQENVRPGGTVAAGRVQRTGRGQRAGRVQQNRGGPRIRPVPRDRQEVISERVIRPLLPRALNRQNVGAGHADGSQQGQQGGYVTDRGYFFEGGRGGGGGHMTPDGYFFGLGEVGGGQQGSRLPLNAVRYVGMGQSAGFKQVQNGRGSVGANGGGVGQAGAVGGVQQRYIFVGQNIPAGPLLGGLERVQHGYTAGGEAVIGLVQAGGVVAPSRPQLLNGQYVGDGPGGEVEQHQQRPVAARPNRAAGQVGVFEQRQSSMPTGQIAEGRRVLRPRTQGQQGYVHEGDGVATGGEQGTRRGGRSRQAYRTPSGQILPVMPPTPWAPFVPRSPRSARR